MLKSDIAFAQFTSKSSSAGVVNVMLGFVPDFAILFVDIDGTNPLIYFWANSATLSLWSTALSILDTGSSGILTRDTTGITVYAGGDDYPDGASQNDNPKYVDWQGNIETIVQVTDGLGNTVGQGDASIGPTDPSSGPLPMKQLTKTLPGLAIPADHQVASGKNVLICFRNNR